MQHAEEVGFRSAHHLQLLNSTARWCNQTIGINLDDVIEQATRKFDFATILNAVTTRIKKSVICIGFTLLIYMFLLFGSSMRKFESTSMRYKIEDQITRYLLIKTILSLIAAAGAYFIYGVLLHLPMAIIFSMLFFVLNFVPHIVEMVPVGD